ncbi:MAG: (d)CMP kinase [Balneolaceae bacterium]
MIIVIDGPAGSGKSSTAKALAEKLGLRILDSGALYRALTVAWLKADQDNHFFENLSDQSMRAKADTETFRVFWNEEELTGYIRSPEISGHVSQVAAHPAARQFVNATMRELVKNGTFIADGRDLGTAVFPDAEVKFFMKASLEERAKRRYRELHEQGEQVTLSEVQNNLEQRDHTDSNRQADPLRQADDAIVIDTTELSFDEQVATMSAIIKKALNN